MPATIMKAKPDSAGRLGAAAMITSSSVAGAPAKVPTTSSSGAQSADTSLAHSAPCPPWE